MITTLDTLKKIGNKALAFKKYLTGSRVTFNVGYMDYQGNTKIKIKLDNLVFKTLENIYRLCKDYIISLGEISASKNFKDLKIEKTKAVGTPIIYNIDTWKTLKSIKFIPDRILFFKSNDNIRTDDFFEYARDASRAVKNKAAKLKEVENVPFSFSDTPDITSPVVLLNSPIEAMEGNHTYRIVTIPTKHYSSIPLDIFVIAREDDSLYNYLDKGFIILRIHEIEKNKSITRYVISNELDVNTMHIFVMCNMQPKLTEMLQDSCFVHSKNASIVRLKMEKKLNEAYKIRYQNCKEYIAKDYNSNTTLQALNKLVREEVEKVAINDITLTKNSASYQNVNIVAEDLLAKSMEFVNFSGEFDIYLIIREYANWIQKQADEAAVPAEVQEVQIANIKINDIDIRVSMTQHYVRKINGFRINKNEIADVIHRASCYHTQKDYELFVMRVNKMSLRWHDALANGLAVKIHETMQGADYNNPKPGLDAPSLQVCLSLEHKRLALNIEGNHIPVKMARLIERIDTINRRTDNRWPRSYGAQARNHIWAQKQLVEALIECTTFEKKKKNEAGEEIIEKVVGVTRKDLEKLLTKANEAKIKAIERSKNFMETAIKLTKAERVEFLGKPALKVTGSLRTYAVVIETAKVYDYDTKQYRCIVNDAHYQGAGYDDIASRLYALKNDSVMQRHISTLSGTAQPQAEHAHDNMLPDRRMDLSHLTEEVLATATLQ